MWFQESRHYVYTLRCRVKEGRDPRDPPEKSPRNGLSAPCLLRGSGESSFLQWIHSTERLILTTCSICSLCGEGEGAAWFSWLQCSWGGPCRWHVGSGNLGRSLRTERCAVPLQRRNPVCQLSSRAHDSRDCWETAQQPAPDEEAATQDPFRCTNPPTDKWIQFIVH